jgi:CheY-like chemotaxis protein
VNLIRPRAAEKSLDFFVNVDARLPAEMRGDDMRLRQILTNLLSNAVKYTQKGFISLDVGMEMIDSNRLRLLCEIEDSGIGIRKSDAKQLFVEFSRVDAKHNQGIEGTGLGLVITRALCRAMGGDVSMESEYGIGSVFRASVIQEFDAQKKAAHIPEDARKKVIFYDDRQQYIQSLSRAFENLAVEAHNAHSFAEFLKQLESGNYDYAFVSSKYAMECISTVGKHNTPLQLIIMVEMGETSVYREVSSIMMPVYTVTLANALNGVEENALQNSKLRVHFTAPTAKILIVDDISTNLRVAKELMNPYNMNVHTCMSGEKAVEMVQSDNYDIVFMDHMMPGMDGIETTAEIRRVNDGKFRDLPIVALTANAVTGQREMFLENGIDDFLAKPIDVQKLDDMLEKWLPAEKCVESARPQQKEDKQEKPRAAISIPGVDVEAGLRNSGGTEAVYLDILSDFCRDAETRAGKILDALNAGDIKLYITLVHALKGAAWSIGAMETGDAAAVLEKSAENTNAELLKYKTDELLGTLRVLTSGIEAVVQKAAEDNEKSSDLALLRLELLTAALADMNIEAVNKMLLEYAGLPLDSKTRGIIAEIEELILLFEYDKAIQKVNQLL